MMILLIIVTGFTIYIEVPGLVKKNYWREIILFSVLLTIGFIFLLLIIIGVKIPSPALYIEKIVNNLGYIINFVKK